MSHIKSINTSPELMVRRYLHAQGLRFRLHVKDLPGKPDIVLSKYHTVIFVHGCFWHGHEGCKYFRYPKSRLEYWKPKIEKNILRDAKVLETLRGMGWTVLIVWECQLKRDLKCAGKTLVSRIQEN